MQITLTNEQIASVVNNVLKSGLLGNTKARESSKRGLAGGFRENKGVNASVRNFIVALPSGTTFGISELPNMMTTSGVQGISSVNVSSGITQSAVRGVIVKVSRGTYRRV